jgi:prevent-host-death family protein
MLTLQETIRPSADLRNHYKEISKQCREDNEAVIITVNGRGDTVSLAYEEYQRMKSRIELRKQKMMSGPVKSHLSARPSRIFAPFCRRERLELPYYPY